MTDKDFTVAPTRGTIELEKESVKEEKFSDKGIQNITGFLITLKKIHIRLASEGYFEGDTVTKPNKLSDHA